MYVETHWNLALSQHSSCWHRSNDLLKVCLMMTTNRNHKTGLLWQTVWLKWSATLQSIFRQEPQPSSDDWKRGFVASKSHAINPGMTDFTNPWNTDAALRKFKDKLNRILNYMLSSKIMPFGECFQTFLCHGWLLVNDHSIVVLSWFI
jgi:hypothetical protein